MAIQIGQHRVGVDNPPFIIAEMSGNHDGAIERALEIVDMAADAGAHAVKLQTYTADTMTLDVDRDEFLISDPKSLWFGRRLYDLYEEAHTPWEWHPEIMKRARDRGIACFSSPFDATAVDFLEDLDVPCYKIASFENIDLPLIAKVASTGKPLIISTGIATFDEVDEAVQTARDAGCDDLILLKCTSAYPASPDDIHLHTIGALRDRYGCEIGLSDHTIGLGVSIASVALGATVIEKHVTMNRADGGVDSAFSLEPAELRSLVVESDHARRALGTVQLGPSEREAGALLRRRSLYFSATVQAGEEITAANLRSIRPGLGLAPKYYDDLIGRMAAVDIERGTPASWDLVTS
jgi:N-acetylneuraminate synthase